jgi:hypothetical protein
MYPDKEPAENKPTEITEGDRPPRQIVAEYDSTQVALESSVMGVLLGLAVFLQSVTGIGSTIGKILGVITFILGMLTFPSWKGKTILGFTLMGVVGGIVYGVLSSIF